MYSNDGVVVLYCLLPLDYVVYGFEAIRHKALPQFDLHAAHFVLWFRGIHAKEAPLENLLRLCEKRKDRKFDFMCVHSTIIDSVSHPGIRGNKFSLTTTFKSSKASPDSSFEVSNMSSATIRRLTSVQSLRPFITR